MRALLQLVLGWRGEPGSGLKGGFPRLGWVNPEASGREELYSVYSMSKASSVALSAIPAAPDLVDRVYQALQDAVCTGALAPGQRITQEEVAAQLAVSRQPVLQALRLLKQDGFLQDAPGRGVQVTPLDVQAMQQVYEVRGALDALAARSAAARRARLDPQLFVRGRKAAAGRQVKLMIDADIAFHEAIYAASGNPHIAQAAQPHWRHLRRVMGAVLQLNHPRDTVWDEHQAIADAIAAADGERAAELITQHAQQASQHLAAQLQQVLQAGDRR
jgi:DNA-binding GntR family transcriptional regulator